MTEISTLRLNLLRAMYAFIALGLAFTRWPELINPPSDTAYLDNVVASMLAAVSLLALVGIRYPLQMLPLLLFELAWKSMWVLRFGLPVWIDGSLDADTRQTLIACFMGIVPIPLVLPWGYIFRHAIKTAGAPWRNDTAAQHPSSPAALTPDLRS
jgi:hypothetical protein